MQSVSYLSTMSASLMAVHKHSRSPPDSIRNSVYFIARVTSTKTGRRKKLNTRMMLEDSTQYQQVQRAADIINLICQWHSKYKNTILIYQNLFFHRKR